MQGWWPMGKQDNSGSGPVECARVHVDYLTVNPGIDECVL